MGWVCDVPCTSPFKEELVAQPLEGWLADDFQYEAIQGWAQLQRGHSPSQFTQKQWQIKVEIPRPGRVTSMGVILAPDLPLGLARAVGQGLHYSHLVFLLTLPPSLLLLGIVSLIHISDIKLCLGVSFLGKATCDVRVSWMEKQSWLYLPHPKSLLSPHCLQISFHGSLRLSWFSSNLSLLPPCSICIS